MKGAVPSLARTALAYNGRNQESVYELEALDTVRELYFLPVSIHPWERGALCT